jgi:toxin ParE1/3/4
MVAVNWSANALRCLGKIRARIAKDNPTAAEKTLKRIDYVASLLKTSPELGERASSKKRFDLYVDDTPYLLVYQINAEGVLITSVIHGRRGARRNRGSR